MNSVISGVIDYIKSNKPDVHTDIASNAAHYVLGMVAGMTRSSFTFRGTDIKLNYFGLTLAGSGDGKDVSVTFAKRAFAEAAMKHAAILEKEFTTFNVKNPDAKLPIPPSEFSKATPEGFMQSRVNCDNVGYGSVNLRIEELQDVLDGKDTEIFSEVVKAWEVGDTAAKINRVLSIPATRGIPISMILYGSPNTVMTDIKVFESLAKMLTSGLGRRSFMVAPDIKETSALQAAYQNNKPTDEEIHEAIKNGEKLRNKIGEHVSKVFDRGEMNITMSKDASLIYNEYEKECSLHYGGNVFIHPGLVAEMKSRPWKTVRLAALYAWVNNKSEIDATDMNDAIEHATKCGEYVEKFFIVPSNEALILEYLDLHSGSSEQQIRSALPKMNKGEFVDSMNLANDLAEKNNQVIERSDESVPKYSLKQLTAIDLDAVTISTSTSLHANWKPITGKFKDLEGFFKSGAWYSAGIFKEGHRTNENYTQSQDLIIFDVDEDMSLDTAKSFFSDFKCIIATTKNHMREKHPGTGDIWDRYRIILVPDSKIEMDPDTYSQFMLNAMDMLGLPADRSCQDPARFFYGNKDAEVWVSEGERLFPVKACIPTTAKSETVHKRLEKYDNVDGIERYFISSTDKGDRNNKLFRYACVLKDDGKYTDDEIEEMVIALNQRIADPLPERELRHTILKSIRKK